MAAPTDETLLQRFQAGDQTSFDDLVRRYAPELHLFVQRFTGNAAAAEDVVQETFVQLFTSADRFEPGRRFKPWLFTIAANKARDHLRSRGRKREVPLDAQIGGDEDGGRRFADLLSQDSPDGEAELLADERRSIVRRVVDQLPERFSEVLVLGYFHRLAYKEIAGILDVPVGTVKSRLHAAVSAFGELYREEVQRHAEAEG